LDILDLIADNKLTDPNWALSPRGNFFRFAVFNPDEHSIKGVSGIYVIWHGGIRSGWVYAAKSADLEADLDRALDNNDIMQYNDQGGLYVTWALIREEYQDGVLRYLLQAMKPLIDTPKPPKDGIDPIPVMVPGAKKAAKPPG